MEDLEQQPLEKKTIRIQFNGVWKEVPAIHRTWVNDRIFPRYVAPHLSPDGNLPLGAKETWLELIQLLQDDLRWLLGLTYNVFWSQVIFNKSTMSAVISFLQEAPPAFCHYKLPDEDMESAMKETSRLVFLVFCRLSCCKESAYNFITPKALGGLLYDNYIFTIPCLLDLCAVYGSTNRQGVQRIIQNVMKFQPQYLGDLTMAEEHLCQILDSSKNMLGAEKEQNSIPDMILHLYDALATIRLFFDVCPQGHVLATPHLVASIATFYSFAMPQLTKLADNNRLVDKLRIECLKTVRSMLSIDVNEALNELSADAVERYLAKVPEILSEGVFVVDYNAVFPIENDLDILVAVCPDMDKLKIDYLLEALSSHTQVDFKPNVVKRPEKKNLIVNYAQTSSSPATSSVAVSGVELQSLITEVQDILPHLGSGFVEACLKYFKYSTESVIAAVLESKLPPAIEELSWDLQLAPLVENERRNVFDNDEFDIMTRDTIDPDRVHRGKKPRKHKNVNELLEDKTEIMQMKDKFSNLGIVEDTTYDDEYDDTYESVDVSAREPDEAERSGRPFVTPRVLRSYQRPEEEESEEEEVEQTFARDAFVPNPEELRARAEQKRRNTMQSRDVVGKPKGQGQEKQVLINRDNKKVHKSSGANHHRRDRASRKRNQGMIPS